MIRALVILVAVLVYSPALASVTTISVKDKSGANQTNIPFTFGHAFKRGDVPSGRKVVLSLSGVPVASQQYDLKTTYADGSARFAVISAVIPAITASQAISYTLDLADATTNSGAITKQQILDSGIAANITLSNLSGAGYSGSATADLRTAITAASSLTYWLNGPACTEILIDKRVNNNLNATWEVRFYPGTSYVRVSHSMENVDDLYRDNVGYDVAVQQGIGTVSTVYSATGVTHYGSARWRKVYWVGTAPPETEIHYNTAYLISTGLVPNYDTSIIVPEGTLAARYATWQASPQELMGNSGSSVSGPVLKYWPTTGAREDIGPLPAWTARYLLSMDNRMKSIMLDAAEKAAAAGFHWREADNTKSFYGHPLSLDDRPGLWAHEWYITNYPEYRSGLLPATTTATAWTLDQAHQASLDFIPYMVTGEKFYLDEMNYLASWSLIGSSPGARNNATGWLTSSGLQIRGVAWAARNVAQAAALALDGSLEKTYFTTKLQNSITKWTADIALNYPLGNMSYDSSCTGGNSNLTANVKYCVAPWMEDYFETSLRFIASAGFDVGTLRTVHSRFIIGRISNQSFNPFDGIVFHFPVVLVDNSSVQTWPQAEQQFTVPNTSYTATDATYKKIALASLASVSDFAGAATAYDWLKAQVYDASGIAVDPTWAIVPSSFVAAPPVTPTTTRVFNGRLSGLWH